MPSRCDNKQFQPGYYDHRTSTWYDHCTGRQTNTTSDSEAEEEESALLSKDSCPIVKHRKNVWVHFVGDSVIRQLFLASLKASGIPTDGVKGVWMTGRNEKFPDHLLASAGEDDYKVWLSYTFDFIDQPPDPNSGYERWTIPKTWGEFLSTRKEGPREDDPGFEEGRTPDIVFFSPDTIRRN